MDYKKNEDMFCTEPGTGKVSYNHVIDVLFPSEDSSPPTEPITVAELKNFAKIDVDEDDVLLGLIVTVARQKCEAEINTGFVKRDIQAVLANGNGGIYLPYGPVGTVSLIDTVAPIDGQIEGVKWKRLMIKGDPITVEYEGGYDVLPGVLKLALLEAGYYLYDNRAVALDDIGEIARNILKPFSRK